MDEKTIEEVVSQECEPILEGDSVEHTEDDAEVSRTAEVIDQEDGIEDDSKQLEYADEREQLRDEVNRLRTRLESIEKENERMLTELGEFSEVFPNVLLEDIPSDVWSSVKRGVPLAAAYALYEKKSRAQSELVSMVNQKNAEQSSGALKGESDDQFYSPSEVRKMSPREVRAKYNFIIESMKRWN